MAAAMSSRWAKRVRFKSAQSDSPACQSLNFTTADVAEAMLAFAQKRDPKFTGR